MTSAINSRRGNVVNVEISCKTGKCSRNFPHSPGWNSAVILQIIVDTRFPIFFFRFFSFCTLDAPCTFSPRLTASNARHKGNAPWQFGQMYFPRPIFSTVPCFRLRDTRLSTFRLLATMRNTEGTKFPKARNGKHRVKPHRPHRHFIGYKRIPVLRIYLCMSSQNWKKLRSNGRVFEVYRRSCNNTERFEG